MVFLALMKVPILIISDKFRTYFFRCTTSSNCKSTEINENNFATCSEIGQKCCAIDDIENRTQTTKLSQELDENDYEEPQCINIVGYK